MKDDIMMNKVKIIERCIIRIKEVYEQNPANLKDYTKQDSILLNIQRACEASIDLAMHLVSKKRLGLPQTSRDAFDLLYTHEIIDQKTTLRLKAMVGFRNIAVHDYQTINLDIVRSIIEDHLDDFTDFTQLLLKLEEE